MLKKRFSLITLQPSFIGKNLSPQKMILSLQAFQRTFLLVSISFHRGAVMWALDLAIFTNTRPSPVKPHNGRDRENTVSAAVLQPKQIEKNRAHR